MISTVSSIDFVLTHPSFSVKTEDHLRTSLSNCGLRRPEYAKPTGTRWKGLHSLNLGAAIEKCDEKCFSYLFHLFLIFS